MWDCGLEFLFNMIIESCLCMDVIFVVLLVYSLNLKGCFERFWGFLKIDVLFHLFGYIDGLYDLCGNIFLVGVVLGEDEFFMKFVDWMDWYIIEYIYSVIGMTVL